MCLKTNATKENAIIKQCNEILKILEDGKLQEKFERYELVRQQGYYNMLDPRARELSNLTEEDYMYIIRNYSELSLRYPNTKEKVRERLSYIRLANISKIIALKGCKNCIELVSKKLDITEKDLCENCKKVLAEV